MSIKRVYNCYYYYCYYFIDFDIFSIRYTRTGSRNRHSRRKRDTIYADECVVCLTVLIIERWRLYEPLCLGARRPPRKLNNSYRENPSPDLSSLASHIVFFSTVCPSVSLALSFSVHHTYTHTHNVHTRVRPLSHI